MNKESLAKLYSEIYILGRHWKTFYSWFRERRTEGQLPERILDAGCGSGEVKDLFKKWKIDIDYHGVDLGIGGEHESYRLTAMADLHNLPYKASSFDKIVSISVLEHVDRPHKVFEEFQRVLRPGGHLFFHVPFVWHEHQVPQDRFRYPSYGIEHMAREHGFKVQEVLSMGGYFTVVRYLLTHYRFMNGAKSNLLKGLSYCTWQMMRVLDKAIAPLAYALDHLDQDRQLTLGYYVWLQKEGEESAVVSDPYRCPSCASDDASLVPGEEHWVCNKCGKKYGQMYGVPKLLVQDDFQPYSEDIKSV